MLNLPKIPYKMEKNKSQIVAMRGINLSNMISDGDMADSKNISARSYPYITTRKARAQVGDYAGVTAMTVFRGKFVVVQGTDLLYDGVPVGKVTPGAKQFTAINTKLVIMPDKKYLDGETLTLHDMGAELMTSGASFTANSLTFAEGLAEYAKGFGGSIVSGVFTAPQKKVVVAEESGVTTYISAANKTINGAEYLGCVEFYGAETTVEYFEYGIKKEATDVTHEGERVYRYRKYMAFPGASDEEKSFINSIEVGDKLYITTLSGTERRMTVEEIDGKTFYCGDSIFESESKNKLPNVRIRKRVNTGMRDSFASGDYLCLKIGGKEYIKTVGYEGEDDGSVYISDCFGEWISSNLRKVFNGFYDAEISVPGWEADFSSVVKAGEEITLRNGIDRITATVSSVTGSSITFADETLTQEYALNSGVSLLKALPDGAAQRFNVGDAVFLVGSSSNDMSFIISEIDGNTIYAENDIFTEGEDANIITIERKIPELDFICESDNRIWGCSNADNTIYASALGDPTNFFDYSGESTDSYAVGVGSEERFTACCRYGGGVLFFKEMKLHKILGSYPAEYALYSYDIEGVQNGCHKSLQIINENLFYKGVHGVFAFNGSPSLISSNFGEKEFGRAVAGNDGDTYYISMSDGERDYLFAYETKYGIWVLEDDVKVSDFARIGRDTYMLCEDGRFYLCGAGESETGIEWLIQFTPLYETIEGKKSYSRIVFRLELPQGSYMIVDVRTDSGVFREAGKVVGKRDGIVPVTIPINRCDKFEIRLRGKGKCTIHQMKREFYVGGER